MSNVSRRERVLRALLSLGGEAALGDIAYQSGETRLGARSILRQLPARVVRTARDGDRSEPVYAVTEVSV